MSRYQPRIHCPCFWRLQDAGWPLSRSHRSRTWSMDGDDDGEEHAGTSAVHSIAELGRTNAYLTGSGRAAELVRFEGREVEQGWDGEPVVIPTREVLRLRKERPRGQYGTIGLGLSGARTVRDLLRAGWYEVPTMQVIR